MKKAAKVCLITSVIIICAGVILFLVGMAGGGLKAAREMAINGELRFLGSNIGVDIPSEVIKGKHWLEEHGSHTHGWGYFYDYDTDNDTDDLYDSADEDTYGENEEIIFDDAFKKYSGDISEQIDISQVTKLEIEFGGGEIYISNEDTDSAVLTSENAREFQCYVKNNTLYLKGLKKWNNIKNGENVVYLVLPEALGLLKKAEFSLGAGYMEVQGGNYGETEIELGAGEIIINSMCTDKLDIEVGAGAAYFYDMEVRDLYASTSVGETVIEGKINGNAELECAMGYLEVTAEGKEEDFNYNVEAASGSIQIGNEEEKSLVGAERYIDNGADKNIEAECTMGSISIKFK